MKLLQPNLLPEAAKQAARYLLLQRVFLRLAVLLTAVSFGFSALLLPSYFHVSFQKSDILRVEALEEQNPVRRRAEEIDEAVLSANRRIKLARNMLAAERSVHQMVSTILAEMSGFHIDRIDFNREARTYAFWGRADQRSDILNFQKRILVIPAVEGVSSPLSNLIRETNVIFTLTVTAKP